MTMRAMLALPVLILLPGCIARTAVDIVTLPVKAASETVDVLTTSEEEADRNRGREIREREEREAKDRRRAEKRALKCARDPDDEDCPPPAHVAPAGA